MYKNIKVEAENLELILRNSHGDVVIIPADKRKEVQGFINKKCNHCIDELVDTLPLMEDYAGDGTVYPKPIVLKDPRVMNNNQDNTAVNTPIITEKTSSLPVIKNKNWGVTDYSDKGSFNSAYSAARKAGEQEFMWNENRYKVNNKNTAGKNIIHRDDFEPINNWAAVEAAGGIRRQETYGKLGDLYKYYAGQPTTKGVLQKSLYKPTNSKNKEVDYISIKDDKFEQEVIDNYDRVFNQKTLLKNEKKINDNTYAVSGYTRPTKEQLKTSKSGELYYEKGKDHVSNAIGHYYLSKGNDERGDYISYYDVFDAGTGGTDGGGLGETLGLTKPFEIYDRIYIKDYGDGKQKRMYYTDKELSELNIDKKDFDTLALQRELSNREYKLPKSTLKDGSLDGIWGDETKNALLEYRKSNQK